MPKTPHTFRIVNAAMRQVHTLDVNDAETFRHAVTTALGWLATYQQNVDERAALSVGYDGGRWRLLRLRNGYAWIERPGPDGGDGQWTTIEVLTS